MIYHQFRSSDATRIKQLEDDIIHENEYATDGSLVGRVIALLLINVPVRLAASQTKSQHYCTRARGRVVVDWCTTEWMTSP